MDECTERTTAAHRSEGEITSVDALLQDDSFHSRMMLIDQEMKRFLNENRGEPSDLYDAAHHLLIAGGKRIRSLITLLCCEAVGGDAREVLPFAIAAELLQTASLIHDDIIDEDLVRRGTRTAHEMFGAKIAILAGDLLVAQAIQLVGERATPELLSYLGRGGVRMCEGEALDFMMCNDNPNTFTRQKYLKVIEYKTATFMKEAARIGAIVGGASEEQKEALSKFGEMIGFAFQIRDDILDVTATQQIAGKSVQSDLKRKRCNYPLIHALEVSPESERKQGLQALESGNLGPILRLIEDTQAIHHAVELTKTYIERAKAALADVELHDDTLLCKIAEFAIQRIH